MSSCSSLRTATAGTTASLSSNTLASSAKRLHSLRSLASSDAAVSSAVYVAAHPEENLYNGRERNAVWCCVARSVKA
jgi:hypothetical protein